MINKLINKNQGIKVVIVTYKIIIMASWQGRLLNIRHNDKDPNLMKVFHG